MKCSSIFKAVLFLAIVLGISMPAMAYSGGEGTASNPYRIATADDLILLGETIEDYDKYFILTADIDLASKGTFTQAVIAGGGYDKDWDFDGTAFTGNFNGNGNIINNLAVISGEYCGLFGYIGSSGIITNLGLENVSVSGSDSVGGLCGENYGTITSSYATGSVSGTGYSVGGLCGCNRYGDIIGSYATGSVSGDKNVGGLCGFNNGGTITNSNASGDVSGKQLVGGLCGFSSGTITSSNASGDVSGNQRVGGLCGFNYGGTIASSYATGSVSGTGFSVGGLCGENWYSIITSSYATGSVSGDKNVGGLCGNINHGTITNSYSTGGVSGKDNVGGLCGEINLGTIINSYATGSVSGNINVGGFCGGTGYPGNITSSFWDVQTSGIGSSGSNNYGAIGKTTAQMQTLGTFTGAGWDFFGETANGTENIWYMLNSDYPRLAWDVLIPGDIAGGWGVDMADLEVLAINWLDSGIGDINPDGIVNMLDFAIIAKNWLATN